MWFSAIQIKLNWTEKEKDVLLNMTDSLDMDCPGSSTIQIVLNIFFSNSWFSLLPTSNVWKPVILPTNCWLTHAEIGPWEFQNVPRGYIFFNRIGIFWDQHQWVQVWNSVWLCSFASTAKTVEKMKKKKKEKKAWKLKKLIRQLMHTPPPVL